MAITTVRWSSIGSQEKFRSLAQATYVAPTPSTMGMVLLTPTSIAHSGTSASIGANGQVTFTAVTSLSLNGVFTGTYDNYVLVLECVIATSGQNLSYRLRSSGTDATTSNYVRQYLQANGVSVDAGRDTAQNVAKLGFLNTTLKNGIYATIYGPFLTQPTASRSNGVSSLNSALLREEASTHSLSASYDGITIIPDANNITGTVSIYGVRS